MKTKKLLIAVFALLSWQLVFAQTTRDVKIFGKKSSSFASKEGRVNKQICNSAYEFLCRGFSTGIAYDGQNFWVVDSGYIYKTSPAGVFLDSMPNPAPPAFFIDLKGGDITYDGSSLWYADEQSATLTKINPASMSVDQQYELPGYSSWDPNGFGIAWDGSNLWFAQYGSAALFKINPANGAVMDSIPLKDTIYTIEYVKGTLYGLGDSTLFKINTVTGETSDPIDWCIPFSIGLSWDGTSLWNLSGPPDFFGEITGGDGKAHKLTGIALSIDKKVNDPDVSLSPNPSSSSVHVKGKQLKAIEIYTVTGCLVYSEYNLGQVASTEIEVSSLSKGVYFAKIYEEAGIATEKLVVE